VFVVLSSYPSTYGLIASAYFFLLELMKKTVSIKQQTATPMLMSTIVKDFVDSASSSSSIGAISYKVLGPPTQ